MINALILAAAAAAVPAPAKGLKAPAEFTLLGITIGKPLPWVECNPSAEAEKWVKNPRKYGGTFPYAIPSDTPCYERPQHPLQATPIGTEGLTVRYPVAIKPAISSSRQFGVSMINGNVSSIQMYTNGIKSQDEDYAAITAKLGQPSYLKPERWENNYGAGYTAIVAAWEYDNGITAIYFSRFPKSDQIGRFAITTREQALLEAAARPASPVEQGL